jgi:hypothetical protein
VRIIGRWDRSLNTSGEEICASVSERVWVASGASMRETSGSEGRAERVRKIRAGGTVTDQRGVGERGE